MTWWCLGVWGGVHVVCTVIVLALMVQSDREFARAEAGRPVRVETWRAAPRLELWPEGLAA